MDKTFQPPVPQPQKLPKCKIAVASLVLGILGLILDVFLSAIGCVIIPGTIMACLFFSAIGCGIIGLMRIWKSKGTICGRNYAIAGIILPVAFYLLVYIVVNVQESQDRVTAAQTDIKGKIKFALDAFEVDNAFYPKSLQDLIVQTGNARNWHGPYLDKLPVDPWGNPYLYYYPGKHNQNSYDLLSVGPDGKEGSEDDIGNWTTK